MIDTHDDSEQFFKDVLQESILKTPSSNFTLQLMLQVAQQNKLRVELKRRLFRQTFLMVGIFAVSFLVWIYMGINFFKVPKTLQMMYSLTSYIFDISESIVSHITEISYLVASMALLLLMDKLYRNFRVTSQR